jgi:hypothetical protein
MAPKINFGATCGRNTQAPPQILCSDVAEPGFCNSPHGPADHQRAGLIIESKPDSVI